MGGRSTACLDSASKAKLRRIGQYMHYLYVLKSINARKSYVGITDNIARRLNEHNSGLSFHTKKYCPWELIYKEEFNNRIEARKRELYFKTAAGRRFIKKHVFCTLGGRSTVGP